MMLAAVPYPADPTAELASIVRVVGADAFADGLERALADDVSLLALTGCRVEQAKAEEAYAGLTRRQPTRYRPEWLGSSTSL